MKSLLPLFFLFVVFLILPCSLSSQQKNNNRVYADDDSEQIQFAVGEIQASLKEKGLDQLL